MRERRQWEKDAMYDAAMDERARRASLAEEGLCFNCEENLVNPQLPSHLCAECFTDKDHTLCDKSGCNRDREVKLLYTSYCKVHAVEHAHSMMEDYKKRKSKIEELKQQSVDGVDQPTLVHKIGVQREGLEAIRETINLVTDQVEDVWPEGYNPPV